MSEVEGLYYPCSENKNKSDFVFAYAKSRFSHNEAQLRICDKHDKEIND